LGAVSAISPGPLLVLIINTALHRGFLAGLRIAVALLLRGVAVNLPKPHAWLLPLTVAAPLVASTWSRSPTSAVELWSCSTLS
jgi:threonine/homoserine/homoserine lactone efflux protein